MGEEASPQSPSTSHSELNLSCVMTSILLRRVMCVRLCLLPPWSSRWIRAVQTKDGLLVFILNAIGL